MFANTGVMVFLFSQDCNVLEEVVTSYGAKQIYEAEHRLGWLSIPLADKVFYP